MGKKRIYDHKTPGDLAQRKLSILWYKLFTGYDTSFLLARNVWNTNRIRMGVAEQHASKMDTSSRKRVKGRFTKE